MNHCAVNVALYGEAGSRWAMTERGAQAVERDADSLRIGRSRLAWSGGALAIDFDEPAIPWGRRLRGRLRLEPTGGACGIHALDAQGLHLWGPIAPRARIEVEVEGEAPWRGDAYFDANFGAEPVERRFVSWDWSRVHRPGETLIYYDVDRRDGGQTALALRLTDRGGVESLTDAPPRRPLSPPAFWRAPRRPRGEAPRLVRTLEDAPFYTRSILADGADVVLHESLSLDRLASPVVKAMLPFRMPRAWR